ncbi:hypothetical protein C3920_13970 [Novacetimonas pomaceti]|uniref:Aspartate aminotransferase family protein n=2 Tax=Novacetimonas pomaceti TaxID=2021998 RepID=A0ABX5P406_9PROT|nr:hypothetical protein C3920_13970 [Novacetimonas pomaceti]
MGYLWGLIQETSRAGLRDMQGCADTRKVFTKSREYRTNALRHLSNGVSSTPRASQRPVPVVIDSAAGVTLTDVDGNRYLDYALGYGPLILGHSPEPVMHALRDALDRGLRTASVNSDEAALADLIAANVPCADRVAFVNTGTEAVQLAIRIARATTGRCRVAKFRCNYHGWVDDLHVGCSPGQDGPATLGQDPRASEMVTLLDWGESDAARQVLDDSFAAVIVEPAAINAGCFAPPAGFLETLRDVTRRHGIVLVFDEVITGFRMSPGGAQACYNVVPDMCVLGKALGAGLPIGAVAGTDGVMDVVSSGRMLHRGTFNGNPLSMAAGVACVSHLQEHAARIYPRMERFAQRISAHIQHEAARNAVAIHARSVGSALQVFAGVRRVDGIGDLAGIDRDATLLLTEELLREGVFTLPRGLMYLSAIHTDEDISTTLAAITRAVRSHADRPGGA